MHQCFSKINGGDTPTSENARELNEREAHGCKIRILSYNFNLLPRGCGGFQNERIRTFLECVDQYDVIMFQEVYALSVLPYIFQRHFCFRKSLLEELKNRGFSHYVMSRQPSYQTMLRHSVLSDNGLVIASRFPIGQRGSYTFRTKQSSESSATRGCLFAEVDVPLSSGGSERLVLFNVHLRPDEGGAQVVEVRRFIESVMSHLHSDGDGPQEDPKRWSPFVLAGDFNIDGIDPHDEYETTRQLSDFMRHLQPVGGLCDVVFEANGSHPPTRPAKLFFQTQSKLSRNPSKPQRQDYFLATPGLKVILARIQKFVASSKRPYVYLSDHFGIAATLMVPNTGRTLRSISVPRRHPRMKVSLAEEAVYVHSNQPSNNKVELFSLPLLLPAALYLNWSTLALLGVISMLMWWSSSFLCVLHNERQFAEVTKNVVAGTDTVVLRHQPREYDTLLGATSLAEMWQRTVHRHRTLPCLGYLSDTGKPEWMTYAAVEALVHDIGAGLRAIGVVSGSVIGVDCNASVQTMALELACTVYGFSTLALVGKRTTVRTLIDEQKVKVVVASRAAVSSLLSCRSRSLETIVYLHPFYDPDDGVMARDVGITLLSFDELEHRGRLRPFAPPLRVESDTALSLSADVNSVGEGLTMTRITHADALHTIRTLAATLVLPAASQPKECVVWFTPFATVFNRLFALGILAHGGTVAATEEVNASTFAAFRPTIVLAHPSLFAASMQQARRSRERFGRAYAWLFEKAYQFRSALIHVHGRDSWILRALFFHSFWQQLGGNVKKIVLSVMEESVSFDLEEHIAVCHAPCLREVFYLPSEGVVCVDGIPAPGLRIQLDPIDALSHKANIGQLAILREDGERRKVPLAATWCNERELSLVGPISGILWPVDYEYAVASRLERTYAQSRYVNDIFLHAEPLQPIIAIVAPNRDTLEFEWQQQQQQQHLCQHPQEEESEVEEKTPSWNCLIRFAVDLLLRDFCRIADENSLPEAQVPRFVHLHPHAFSDHENLLTPYGRIRRGSVTRYFKSVLERFDRRNSESPENPSPGEGGSASASLSEEDSRAEKKVWREPFFHLRVPVCIDIGGTFAKIVFVQPPGAFSVPDYLMPESSSLSEALEGRTLRFFADPAAAEAQLRVKPHSKVGRVRFAKLPSKCIPDFISFLGDIHGLDLYVEEYRGRLRATGGGAFKYATIARNKLNASIEVMREMDAVVHGLNLVLRAAPESIFTVDPPTGEYRPHMLPRSQGDGELSPFPYLLVNIGSGISIIKCFGPDGKHVRVGGSPIGGATFWGLVRTMTNLTSWEEVMEIMRLDGPGDNKNVDLLVGDIYGYNAKDLPAMLSVETVASTFGKCGTERFFEASSGVRRQPSFSSDDVTDLLSPTGSSAARSPKGKLKTKAELSSIDIVRSLLNMISSNVTQLAYLHSRVQDVQNIFFAGGFVRNNQVVRSHITSTLQYWSSGERFAHFLKHDGYLGALGSATMLTDEELNS